MHASIVARVGRHRGGQGVLVLDNRVKVYGVWILFEDRGYRSYFARERLPPQARVRGAGNDPGLSQEFCLWWA